MEAMQKLKEQGIQKMILTCVGMVAAYCRKQLKLQMNF